MYLWTDILITPHKKGEIIDRVDKW